MFTGIIEELGTIAHMDRRPDSIRLTHSGTQSIRRHAARRQHRRQRRLPDRDRSDGLDLFGRRHA